MAPSMQRILDTMDRPRRLMLAALALLLLCAPSVHAAGAPTKEEWGPMKAKIDSQGVDARADLTAFMQGRVWPDGFVKLADLDRLAGDYEACKTHADQALTQALNSQAINNDRRDEVRTDAAWLLVHAFNKSGQPEQGERVLERFGRYKDVGGRIHFRLSQGALLMGDYDRAKELVAQGMTLAQQQGRAIPLEYRLHEASIFEARAAHHGAGEDEKSRRLALQAREAAAASYARALKDDPDMVNVMFNLARMQHSLAHDVAGEKDSYLGKSITTYGKLLHLRPGDAEARVGLALVLLDRKQYKEAESQFKDALNVLEGDSTSRASTLQTAYRGRGTAELKLAEQFPDNHSFRDAYALLTKARELGDDSPELYNNLLIAALKLKAASDDPTARANYQKVADEAQEKGGGAAPLNLALVSFENGTAIHQNPGEDHLRIKQGIAALDSAANIYQQALGLGDDPKDWSMPFSIENKVHGPTWRYLGHCHRMIADLHAVLAGIEGGDKSEVIDAARDRSGQAYLIAGNLVDSNARDHFLYYECLRSGRHGYDAAWTYLGWKSYMSLTGWATMFGNYGASGAWKNPLHLGIWGALFLLPLLIALKGLLIGKKVSAPTPGRGDPNKALTGRENRGEQAKDKDTEAKPPAGKDKKPSKDATFVPNTVVRTKEGALERREAERRRSSTDGGKKNPSKDETLSYKPSTDAAAAPKKPVNKAAAQVAKRLAQKQEANKDDPPSARRPAARRRRR